MRALKARVGATRVILNRHRGDANFEMLSSLQARALADHLKDMKVEPKRLAEASSAVVAIGWARPEDARSVLDVLKTDDRPSTKRRRSQQNYLSIINYGTAEWWEDLMAPETTAAGKLSAICQLALTLGLRLPTEPTAKFMTSLWQCVAQAPDALARQDPVAKALMLRHM